MSWIAEKRKIAKRIKDGKPQPPDPGTLELKEIQRADQVFQHRQAPQWEREKHIKELGKSLKNSEKEHFNAMTVFWVGDGWMLIDGHHRYEAYRKANYSKPVPVQTFQGTLDEALGQAAGGNTKDKLPMSSAEKSNAAWRLVIGSNLSINKTRDATGMSRQTVISMRKVRDTLIEEHGEDGLAELDWLTARLACKGVEKEERDYDHDWMQKEAEALAQTLVKKHGKELSKNPEVLWKALQIYDARITGYFLELHGIDPITGEQYEDEFGEPEF